MTMQAVWNGVAVAESDDTVVVEGNHYFPPDSLRREYFAKTWMRSVCPWKGIAVYYRVTVDGLTIPNVAWSYPHPTPFARKIKNYVAFWNGVEVIEQASPESGGGQHG